MTTTVSHKETITDGQKTKDEYIIVSLPKNAHIMSAPSKMTIDHEQIQELKEEINKLPL